MNKDSLYPPATGRGLDSVEGAEVKLEWNESLAEPDCVLELADGLALSGQSFGAHKSVAGECVFQTGEFGEYLLRELSRASWLESAREKIF